MDPVAKENHAARAILYVAKGICRCEFPTSHVAAYSKRVMITQNASPVTVNGQPVVFTDTYFDAELWHLIAPSLPTLGAMPFKSEEDLLPVAVAVLRDALEEYRTPNHLVESPEHPAGRRTPGWEAKNDPFDP